METGAKHAHSRSGFFLAIPSGSWPQSCSAGSSGLRALVTSLARSHQKLSSGPASDVGSDARRYTSSLRKTARASLRRKSGPSSVAGVQKPGTLVAESTVR